MQCTETTHIWTPGYENPYLNRWTFRRWQFRKQQDGWYSKDINDKWVKSGNNDEWFKTEIEEGYLVTMDEFNHPDFQCKKEHV